MNEFFANINWITVAITFAVAILLFNLIQIIRLYIRKKTAQARLKIINEQVDDIKAQLAAKKKKLDEILKNKTDQFKNPPKSPE